MGRMNILKIKQLYPCPVDGDRCGAGNRRWGSGVCRYALAFAWFFTGKKYHAPGAVGIYELGIVRDTAAPEPLMTMGDLPNLCRAQWLADTADAMGLLQQGGVDVSFIGGAQVDSFGNLNTSYIGGIETVETRLPGQRGSL